MTEWHFLIFLGSLALAVLAWIRASAIHTRIEQMRPGFNHFMRCKWRWRDWWRRE